MALPILRRARQAIAIKLLDFRFCSRDATTLFSDVYARGVWGRGGEEWYSGGGSDGQFTDAYVEAVAALARQHAVRSVIDLGCGDFRVGRRLCAALPEVSYLGVDVVPALVERNRRRFGTERVTFSCADITSSVPPPADLCLVTPDLPAPVER